MTKHYIYSYRLYFNIKTFILQPSKERIPFNHRNNNILKKVVVSKKSNFIWYIIESAVSVSMVLLFRI